MKDKKELAAIAAVVAVISSEPEHRYTDPIPPNVPSPWQTWGARQTMQYRDITQRRIIKRVR